MIIYENTKLKRFGNFMINFSFRLSHLKTGVAVGTYSICSDGKHIIYLDYDNFREEWLLDELRYLRDKYKLSNFYILSSSLQDKKYKFHAVCFDKVNARLYNEIVLKSNADMLFKKNNFFDNENARVLRFSGKNKSSIKMPKYYGFLKSKFHQRKKSLGHINFYRKMFNMCITNINHDNKDDIQVIRYTTQNI